MLLVAAILSVISPSLASDDYKDLREKVYSTKDETPTMKFEETLENLKKLSNLASDPGEIKEYELLLYVADVRPYKCQHGDTLILLSKLIERNSQFVNIVSFLNQCKSKQESICDEQK